LFLKVICSAGSYYFGANARVDGKEESDGWDGDIIKRERSPGRLLSGCKMGNPNI
jgi:hypothetical protein